MWYADLPIDKCEHSFVCVLYTDKFDNIGIEYKLGTNQINPKGCDTLQEIVELVKRELQKFHPDWYICTNVCYPPKDYGGMSFLIIRRRYYGE